ncbi:hypothetical protein GCM10012288_08120 [Malaciobacter pacificus]|jgi:flagellar basal-body rod modification protein FlgD|uniref:Basal-body rod modification protein FlgD n=1 Tax=Malaciobacter pacificus TaxID=1080223 RepID=A0A5C2H871_9BACT|nr:flagellar hook capping FlgD N-terminal domain-containing protein [Malaciobacter pacificus]QEP35137.1 flagellar hook assembly protein [Malaciobacter pacificus]GGD36474.1 hypothetical protein GCM10012288_08120 [Malaciobacter pacificus]
MADNIAINSNTGVDGNSYTSSISNDQLTNEDFLNLMIQELKLQDPTKPMDSQQMLATQMQMSTIETNQQTIAAMQSLQTAFSQNALSNAANIIGKNIEDGNIGENGVSKAYTVRSVENVDGEIQVIAQQMLYLEDRIITDEEEPSIINYNVNGEIMDENGNLTGDKIALNNPGEPLLDEDGKLVVLDENNEQIEHNYKLAGVSSPVYSDELTSIPFSTITKVF